MIETIKVDFWELIKNKDLSLEDRIFLAKVLQREFKGGENFTFIHEMNNVVYEIEFNVNSIEEKR